MNLAYQYMVIFLFFKPHQVIFIVDKDDNGKFRLERVNYVNVASL